MTKNRQILFSVMAVAMLSIVIGLTVPAAQAEKDCDHGEAKVPSTITDLSAIKDIDGNFTLFWTTPDFGGADFKYYKIYYQEIGTEKWVKGTWRHSGDTSYTYHNLDSESDYIFKMKTANKIGSSENSNIAEVPK